MFQDPIVNTFFSLALIVAVLVIALLLVKKFAIKAKKIKSGNLGLEVISKISLQPKNNLYIIRVGNRKLLIGANEHHISAIADLSTANRKQSATKQNGFVQNDIDVKKEFEKKVASDLQKSADKLSFKAFLNSAFRKSE